MKLRDLFDIYVIDGMPNDRMMLIPRLHEHPGETWEQYVKRVEEGTVVFVLDGKVEQEATDDER